jgi:hypothetical protein
MDRTDRHKFYHRMCVECGELNLRKRNQTADLHGRVAVVTGARIKIGYEIALKLLRAGCPVIVTTRFRNDALVRYAAEPDFRQFCDRLQIEPLELRSQASIDSFCTWLCKAHPRVDILINNAAQTLRRPPAFYRHLIANEIKRPQELIPALLVPAAANIVRSLGSPTNRLLLEQPAPPPLPKPQEVQLTSATTPHTDGRLSVTSGSSVGGIVASKSSADGVVASWSSFGGGSSVGSVVASGSSGDGIVSFLGPPSGVMASGSSAGGVVSFLGPPSGVELDEWASLPMATRLTQAVLVPEDRLIDLSVFPEGKFDAHHQQVDERPRNSWILRADDISDVECAEVHTANAVAPFMLIKRMTPLLRAAADATTIPADGGPVQQNAQGLASRAHKHGQSGHEHDHAYARRSVRTQPSHPHQQRRHGMGRRHDAAAARQQTSSIRAAGRRCRRGGASPRSHHAARAPWNRLIRPLLQRLSPRSLVALFDLVIYISATHCVGRLQDGVGCVSAVEASEEIPGREAFGGSVLARTQGRGQTL